MKKIIISILISSLFIGACGFSNENIDNNVVSEETNQEKISKESNESKEDSKGSDNNEKNHYKLQDLNGSYIYITSDDRVRVNLKDGVLRFSDQRGNVRYRIADSADRIVISFDIPEVYKVTETEQGYELMQIDELGKSMGSEINLERIE